MKKQTDPSVPGPFKSTLSDPDSPFPFVAPVFAFGALLVDTVLRNHSVSYMPEAYTRQNSRIAWALIVSLLCFQSLLAKLSLSKRVMEQAIYPAATGLAAFFLLFRIARVWPIGFIAEGLAVGASLSYMRCFLSHWIPTAAVGALIVACRYYCGHVYFAGHSTGVFASCAATFFVTTAPAGLGGFLMIPQFFIMFTLMDLFNMWRRYYYVV